MGRCLAFMKPSITHELVPSMDSRGVFRRAARDAVGSVASALVLAACGGGGGGGGTDPATVPTVSSATAGAAKYSQTMLLTVAGSNLDQGLEVSATGCEGISLSAQAPWVSSSTTAYYRCTVSAIGPGEFVLVRSSDGAALATAAFSVPRPQVTLTVSNGDLADGQMIISLAPDKTPVTVNNFLAYVNSGFYDGTVFHRVSPGFVIQGGGYVAPVDSDTPTLKPTSPPISLEVGKGLSNTQWTIAMARTPDPASATSQFFINLVDNSGSLDPNPLYGEGYAVFGTVSGIDTVIKIAQAPCVAIPFFLASGECTPLPNVVITSAVQSQ